jgi:hypothetical protein
MKNKQLIMICVACIPLWMHPYGMHGKRGGCVLLPSNAFLRNAKKENHLIVICAACIPLGMHRSVESVTHSCYCIPLGMHPYWIHRKRGGCILTAERCIPAECRKEKSINYRLFISRALELL